MSLELNFFGAARNVTGSRILLKTNTAKILVDCGVHQERSLRDRDWAPFPVSPATIGAVLLTHAHLDHCGYLPRLIAHGFKGPVFATPATCEIAKIVLLDSAHIQEEDALRKRKRHRKQKRKSPYGYEPLYTTRDAEKAIEHFSPVSYHELTDILPGIQAKWHDAGHILGSGSIEIQVSDSEGMKRILFSGDIGRNNTPILRDPEPAIQSDIIVIESTYGDRQHGPEAEIASILKDVINQTVQSRGNIIIPSFAIGRTQELLYHLNALLEENLIPPLPVFVDSPMAIRVTEVFTHFPQIFDDEMSAYLNRGESPFDSRCLYMTRTTAQSKAINSVRGSAVIIAGSGMCTGGRIKHHLVHNISDSKNTILFPGYQAHGTLGRHILEGAKEIRLFGSHFPVRANIVRIPGLSAHADSIELESWITKGKDADVFVVHGEENSAFAFADQLRANRNLRVRVPDYLDRTKF